MLQLLIFLENEVLILRLLNIFVVFFSKQFQLHSQFKQPYEIDYSILAYNCQVLIV